MPPTIELWLFAAFALGHACVVILATNTSHGLNLQTRHSEAITVAAILTVGLLSLAGLIWIGRHPDTFAWPWALRLYAGLCILVGAVGFPLVTLIRLLRRQPRGIHDVIRESTAIPADRSTLIGGGSRVSLLYWPGNESLRLTLRECRVALPGLPTALDGLRIAHLTDLHMAPCYERRYFEAVAESVAASDPDLILGTGDIIEDDSVIEWIGPVLGGIRGTFGQFSILGNHDLHHDPDRIRGAMEQAGFVDVEGSWTTLKVSGVDLAIGGTNAPWGRDLDLKQAPVADFRIILSHSPDPFHRIVSSRAADLVLAGHNHGGQIRLPVVGPVLMPSVYSRRFDRGFFQRDRTMMYVGQGIGGKHPIRWNCPPELTILELRARASSEESGADLDPRSASSSTSV